MDQFVMGDDDKTVLFNVSTGESLSTPLVFLASQHGTTIMTRDEAQRLLDALQQALPEQIAIHALRVIALSYRQRIDRQDTPAYIYAQQILEQLGEDLERIPNE